MIWEKIVVLSVRFVKIRITILGADTDRSSQSQMPYSWKHSVHLYRTLGTTASTCIAPLEPQCPHVSYPRNQFVHLYRTLGTTLSTFIVVLELLCQPVLYPWNYYVNLYRTLGTTLSKWTVDNLPRRSFLHRRVLRRDHTI